MNEQIRAEFEQAAVVLGYNVEQHPIHTDMYLFSVTNDAYRLFQATHSRYAGSGSEVKRCEYCYDTGDVHRADGEWLGVCKECTRPTPAVPDGWRIQRVSEHQFEVEHPDTSTVSVSDEGPIRNMMLYELCLALATSQAGEPPATHSSWDDTYDGWGQLRREAEADQEMEELIEQAAVGSRGNHGSD